MEHCIIVASNFIIFYTIFFNYFLIYYYFLIIFNLVWIIQRYCKLF